MNRSIPAGLARNVKELSGDAGLEWLRSLPEMLRELEDAWRITIEEPFKNGEYNYVARAVTHSGVPCVIKVAPPCNDRDHFGEAKYLRFNDGKGVVRLLAHEPDKMAMLIERAVPGETLTSIYTREESGAITPAVEVLMSTSRRLPDDPTDVILLDDWFDGLRRCPGTAFPATYATRALQIYQGLSMQSEFVGYLHGDFHPDNIVSATREGFLLIDPKGMIGHLGYEIAVFLNNFHWWQDDAPDIRERLTVAVEEFASAFSISGSELREWAYAQMVLSAWWTFDEMPSLYDNEVAKADIWDV